MDPMSMTKPGGHPLVEVLLQFVQKKLSAQMHVMVADHVEHCGQCQKNIAKNFFRPDSRRAA